MSSTPIAIIGISSIFSKAKNLSDYWQNIFTQVDGVTDVPPSRWKIEDYYDPDPSAPDKTYCKTGAFIPEIDFNPMEFGMPPNILEITDVSQLLALVAARDLIENAGYGPEGREFNSRQTGVILGVTAGLKLMTPLGSRLEYPIWREVLTNSGISDEDTENIIEKIKKAYVPWSENAFPGLLPNVVAGRVTNRFNLGGGNFTSDAACASSLAAVQAAISHLLEGRSEMMIAGGVDTDNSPLTYLCFSKTPALSKRGESRPFDEKADGMLPGEGVGMILLKRLENAERDGDTIYAVIHGTGSSSDGRSKSIYAPSPKGQAKALRQAYEYAGFEPSTIGLLEAHGTGTNAGDAAEVNGLRLTFGDSNHQHIALGSVKSQIGHTKGAAGVAGLIKAALALHHKVLPPTINVDKPNPKLNLQDTPFYLNTETRPWIKPEGGAPRRAGVSAFGFGGTNFHAVLEEYTPEHAGEYRLNQVAQPLLFFASDVAELEVVCQDALSALQGADSAAAYDEYLAQSKSPQIPQGAVRVGFAAESLEEAISLLKTTLKTLASQPDAERWDHPKGIYYRQSGLDSTGKVVALFPGQGSQYRNMGRDLALNFPPMREMHAQMDALFIKTELQPPSEIIFPIPVFDDEAAASQAQALRATEYAQPAIGVTSAGIYRILEQAGFKPDFTSGHSFGELTALWAGGVLDDENFLTLVKARGQAMAPPDDPDFDAGSMLAVKGNLADIEKIVTTLEDVIIANQNSPNQVVLAGPTPSIENAAQNLGAQGFKVTPLPVSAAFHTSLVEHAAGPFGEAVSQADFASSQIPVFSNTTAKPYPTDEKDAKNILADHILNPVIFKAQIEEIYKAGGRIFVEIGPRRIVTNLVNEILKDKPHVAIAMNSSRRKSSDRQLRDAVVQLRVTGLNLGNIDPWEKQMMSET